MYLNRAWQSRDLVPAAHFHRHILFHRHRASDGDLDLFSGTLTDPEVVFALHMVTDRLVEAVAADPQRSGDDDPIQRDDCNFGRASSDVDDHIARWVGHRHPSANRRR